MEQKTLNTDGTELANMIMAKSSGEEQGELSDIAEVDMDVGDTDDFEITIPANEWDRETLGYDCRVFIPDTEYGGIIKDIESVTGEVTVVVRGFTWRGMLRYKVVEPPTGQDHLVLSGELNDIIRVLIGNRFNDLFVVPMIDTKVTVEQWVVDRYVTLYDAIAKLLNNYGYRLKIAYVQPAENDYGYVSVQAVPITNYSEELEYSEEGNVNVDVRECRSGVNHLVCAGEGENQERTVLHLYVQKDGSIGEKQYYSGLNEVAAVYSFTSADEDQLRKDGTERLKELQSYKKCQMTIEGMDLELGDIVAGYDVVTNTQVIQPIVQKILRIQKGTLSIEYKVKGDD